MNRISKERERRSANGDPGDCCIFVPKRKLLTFENTPKLYYMILDAHIGGEHLNTIAKSSKARL